MKLLPCPFCGKRPEIKVGMPFHGFIRCPDLHTNWRHPEQWNTRQTKIHACKCPKSEGGRTVRKIDEGLWQCPRCGGIIVTNNGLVELDEKEVRMCIVNGTQQNWKYDYDLATQSICKTFGKPREISENTLEKILYGVANGGIDLGEAKEAILAEIRRHKNG